MIQMPPINLVRLSNVANLLLNDVLAASADIEKMQGRTGVAICVADHGGFPHAVISLGEAPSEEKRRKYFELAPRKCRDLSVLMSASDAMTTRVYKNDDYERFVGATAGSLWLYGTSGFIGELDEVVSIGVSVGMGDLSLQAARSIGKNNQYPKILERV